MKLQNICWSLNDSRHAVQRSTRQTPLAQRTPHPQGLTRPRAFALAALICIGVAQHPQAQALTLGKAVVQSIAGEPLRAEIDVPRIDDEEAASLQVGVAPVNTLRAAGLEIHPALADLQITLRRRPDKRAFLSLTSPHPVTTPFMDLILEVHWSSGRIVRDYTLFFDQRSEQAATLQPVVIGPAVAEPTPVAPRPAPTDAAPHADGGVNVRSGDTAGAIAASHIRSGISLDQMLLAMLRQNPDAFVSGNVNRLKAGVVLNMPDAADAGRVESGKARQLIEAQSRDFNAFRRRLAGRVPKAATTPVDRRASGEVDTEVRESASEKRAADHLTLSKESASSARADQIAQERQAKESSTRVAELSRNIDALSTLGVPDPLPAQAFAAAPAPTPLPVESLSTTPVAITPSSDEPTFFARLRDNPRDLMVCGLLTIAIALGILRYRGRHRGRAEVDTEPV